MINYSLSIDNEDNFFHIPVFVEVDLLPCPVGFQLVRGKCVCHQILLDNNIDSCSFSNGTAFIMRPAPYWIGLPNDTNSSILIHPHCPYDYCKSEDMEIIAESPNAQCQYQRSGVLCGSCHEGLSMILGSSECKTCSNVYLTSFGIFILMGVALVTMVTILNMTVSVGTLNGLINPRRACARGLVLGLSFRPSVRRSFFPSVCLSVTTFSATTRNETTKQRYQRVRRRTGFILKKAIFV